MRARMRQLMILTLAMAAGCAVLPDLPRDGEQGLLGSEELAPPRGTVLFFKVRPEDHDLFRRVALLNPATINENTGRDGYWHVGLSLGGGRMIHAYGTVRIDPIGACGPYDAFASGATAGQTERAIALLRDRLGEEYDLFEAMTQGGLDDPKKPICTSLLVQAFRGIPDQGNGLSDLLSFIDANQGDTGFISANAWARYYTDQAETRVAVVE